MIYLCKHGGQGHWSNAACQRCFDHVTSIKMAHRLLGKSSLGASSFFTSATHPDACGDNGLPLVPKGIQILGRFQKIKEISHKNLCAYLDLVRLKNGDSCACCVVCRITSLFHLILYTVSRPPHSSVRILLQQLGGHHFQWQQYGVRAYKHRYSAL